MLLLNMGDFMFGNLFKYKKSFNIIKNRDVLKQLRLILLKFNIINFNISIKKDNEYFCFLNNTRLNI